MEYKDNEEVSIEQIQSFLSDSSSWYKSLNSRKKRDLEIASGDFWTSDVKSEYDRTGRICRSFNQYSKYANAIVSPYSKAPYHLQIENPDLMYKSVQDKVDEIENKGSLKSVVLDTVRRASIQGVGFMVLSFDDNEIVPESVRDCTSVALDPSCVEVDASDSEQGALVNYISIKRARREFGEDVCTSNGRISWTLPESWSIPVKSIPDVRYWVISSDGQVDFCRVIGSQIVQREHLPIKRIPIFRIAYNEVLRDGKIDYSGIVDQTLDLQIGLNLGYSTLLERCNRTPKANFMMPASALDGLEEFYKKLHTKESLVCLYNGNVPPTPITETYQTQDLMQTIQTCNDLISSVIGIPSQGLNPVQNSQTATEILIQQNNSESNVNSLYDHAYEAVESLSRSILEAVCYQEGIEKIPEFSLINGPQIINDKKRKRQELLAVSSLLDEKSKKIIAHHYIKTLDEDLQSGLIPDLVANTDDVQFLSDRRDSREDPYAIQIMKQLQAQIDEYQKQMEGLLAVNQEQKQEIDQLNLQLMNQKEGHLLELRKHQDEMALKFAELDEKNRKSLVQEAMEESRESFDQVIEIEKLKSDLIKG